MWCNLTTVNLQFTVCFNYSWDFFSDSTWNNILPCVFGSCAIVGHISCKIYRNVAVPIMLADLKIFWETQHQTRNLCGLGESEPAVIQSYLLLYCIFIKDLYFALQNLTFPLSQELWNQKYWNEFHLLPLYGWVLHWRSCGRFRDIQREPLLLSMRKRLGCIIVASWRSCSTPATSKRIEVSAGKSYGIQ